MFLRADVGLKSLHSSMNTKSDPHPLLRLLFRDMDNPRITTPRRIRCDADAVNYGLGSLGSGRPLHVSERSAKADWAQTDPVEPTRARLSARVDPLPAVAIEFLTVCVKSV